jgi:hypothetical protein
MEIVLAGVGIGAGVRSIARPADKHWSRVLLSTFHGSLPKVIVFHQTPRTVTSPSRIINTLVAFLICAPVALPQAQQLFNGENLLGWHIDVPAMDDDPTVASPFIVRDGKLVSLAEPGGHIISDAVYANYRLEVQYRFAAEPGNCGVLVHVSTPRALYGMFPKAIEAQLMHTNAGDFWCIAQDITTPNMEARRGPRENWGVDGDRLRRIPNLTDGSENPVGEWNTMIIECVGDEIKVWVNGDLVNYGYDCEATSGQIALQAEGAEVEFRKVELKPITALTE